MHFNNEWEQILASKAREYCHLIEQLDQVSVEWLDHLTALLPLIHAAVCALPVRESCRIPMLPDSDLDKRFELYTYVCQRLDEHDNNLLTYEKAGQDYWQKGSLADDITDIYFELKKGLELLYSDPAALSRVIEIWRGGFFWHWGEHLVDAERHLYDLHVHRYLAVQPERLC